MRKRLTTPHLVALYTEQHLTMDEIGRLWDVTRQAIQKRLKRAGISRRQGERIVRPCAYCGVEVNKPRSQAKGRINVFCCADHYYAHLENPDYQQWRHGGRLARAIVAQHYPLQRDQVVHHKDGNQRNNNLCNLAVYASQADHLAVHRGNGKHVVALWDGATDTYMI